MSTTHGSHVILYSLVFLLVLGVGMARGGAADTPRKGGTLRVTTEEPATLDLNWKTRSFETVVIAHHYLEGLYTMGLDGGTIPMVAEGHTVSDDGLVYTFKLRRRVPFHHGKELTAADVVPSLIRWGRMLPEGKELFKRVESINPVDKYTVQMRLQKKYALVLPLLGSRLSAAIYPKEVVEEAGEGEVKTFIGTCPFKFAEHQPGRSVKLVRFEQYQARPEPPNGYGGGKTAWWSGWNRNPDFEKLLHTMATKLQFEKRYRLWQDIHRLFWERVPVIQYGHRFGLCVMRQQVHWLDRLGGPFDRRLSYYWNVWLA
jgi:ABC-type transport system substrate-binding protein